MNTNCMISLCLFSYTHIHKHKHTCFPLDRVTKSISVPGSVNRRWITIKYCLRIFSLSFLIVLCLFHWKMLYHSAMKALSFLAHIRTRERKRAECFSKQNNDTSSRSLACVHSSNLHNNLSEVKGGRARRKIARMKERIKGRNVRR